MLFLHIGLSGCQESPPPYTPPTFGDTDKIELISCTIETYGSISNNSSEVKKIGNGFIHDNSSKYSYYLLNGTIKNIAPFIIHKIRVVINFCNRNNTSLVGTAVWVYELRRNFTDTFQVKYTSEQPHFENITQVTIEFRADEKIN